MVHYKLHYLDCRGRGEPIRLIFVYNNIPWEDHKFTWEEWPDIKPTLPFQKSPVLEIDGVILPECYAICRYLGRKYGLAGKDDWESAQLDSIADAALDFVNRIENSGCSSSMGEEIDTLYNEEWLPASSDFFPRLVKFLKDVGSGFYGKSGVSWVDFYLAELTLTFTRADMKTMEKYPELLAHMKKVHSLPQLQTYLSKRKFTYST